MLWLCSFIKIKQTKERKRRYFIMNIEKLVLSTAKGVMTVGEYGFKGAK